MNWKDYLIYDESSPSNLRWAVNVYGSWHGKSLKVAAGDVAGSHCKMGEDHVYWQVTVQGVRLAGHRAVWELHNGEIPDGLCVDHINGDKLDNRIENLRIVPHALNMRNMKMDKRNKSGVTGVSKSDKTDWSRDRSPRTYWSVQWHEVDGKKRAKHFRIEKYGDAEAFRLACEWRNMMIEEQNRCGAGYTERHGRAA